MVKKLKIFLIKSKMALVGCFALGVITGLFIRDEHKMDHDKPTGKITHAESIQKNRSKSHLDSGSVAKRSLDAPGRILAIENPLRRLQLFCEFLENASKQELLMADAWLSELQKNGRNLDTECYLLQISIGSVHKEESMPRVDEKYRVSDFHRSFLPRMEGWARTDAHAAVNWWKNMAQSDRKSLLTAGLVAGLGSDNTSLVLNLYNNTFHPSERVVAADKLSSLIVEKYGVENAISAWHDHILGEAEISDTQSRSATTMITRNLVSKLTSVGDEEMSMLRGLADKGYVEAGTLMDLGRRMALVEPVMALDAMIQFDSIGGQSYTPPAGLEETAKKVGQVHPAILAEWLNEHPKFPGREQIASILVDSTNSKK